MKRAPSTILTVCTNMKQKYDMREAIQDICANSVRVQAETNTVIRRETKSLDNAVLNRCATRDQ